MSNSMKTPKFIWLSIGIILIVVAGYALFSNQRISRLAFPGGEVQFELPQPKDETVRFAVIHDISYELLPVRVHTVIYIDGRMAAKLVVEPNKRVATASIAVPTPGIYSYVLEQEVQILFTDPASGKLHSSSKNKKQMGGRGTINVKRGEAFIVALDHYPNSKGMLILRSIEEDEAERKKVRKMETLIQFYEDKRLLNNIK